MTWYHVTVEAVNVRGFTIRVCRRAVRAEGKVVFCEFRKDKRKHWMHKLYIVNVILQMHWHIDIHELAYRYPLAHRYPRTKN